MPSLAKDLFRRRVPHMLALYLGASWGFVQFVDFVQQRYLLSPYWTDMSLLGLGLLLPSVLLVTYHHGQPGADRWVRSEKIGVPTNFAVAGAVLFFLFGGKDLGAVTTTVTVEDEEGQIVERVVPKSEFRKRLAVFDFDWEGGDEDARWVEYGLPRAVAVDLLQDLFVDLRSTAHFKDRLREAGFEDGVGVPLALKRDIADELHMTHFLAGSVREAGGTYTATVTVHDARTGRAVEERTYSGDDVLALADEISVRVKEDLEIPAGYLEEVQDLPVREMLTASPEAYRRFVEAITRIQLHDDWQGGVEPIRRAVELDPTFALAQYSLFGVHFLSNRIEEGREAIQAAMDHLYKLPDRLQFLLKSDYYFVNQDVQRAYAVIDMWVELYPDDIEGHTYRAMIQGLRDDVDGAIASYERILELDPAQKEHLRTIGQLHQGEGRFEQALEYFERYAAEFADDPRSFTSIGNLRELLGEHAEARANFEKALLLEPGDVGIMIEIASLDRKLGRFEEALGGYERAMEAARTPQDRAAALDGLSGYHRFRGRMERAIELAERSLGEKEQYMPPMQAVGQRLQDVGLYVHAGRPDVAYDILRAYGSQLPEPLDRLVNLGRLSLHLAREDADSVAVAVEAAEELIRALGYEFIRPMTTYARGRVHELRGEYEEALAIYRQELEMNPTDVTIHEQLGRCHRHLGDLDRAQEALEKVLAAVPADPSAHHEMALVYRDRGQPDRAREHLERALDVWDEASPAYRPAARAREAWRELQETLAAAGG